SSAALSYSVTYTLGSNPELSATGGTWALNLAGAIPLAVGTYSVQVHTANDIGESSDSSLGSLVISSTPPVLGALNSPSAEVGATISVTTQVIGGDTTGLTAII